MSFAFDDIKFFNSRSKMNFATFSAEAFSFLLLKSGWSLTDRLSNSSRTFLSAGFTASKSATTPIESSVSDRIMTDTFQSCECGFSQAPLYNLRQCSAENCPKTSISYILIPYFCDRMDRPTQETLAEHSK